MKNLSAEMIRSGVRNSDLCLILNCTDKTIRNKLSGATEFSVKEAMRIRDTFFPGLRLEYLFATDDDQKTA